METNAASNLYINQTKLRNSIRSKIKAGEIVFYAEIKAPVKGL